MTDTATHYIPAVFGRDASYVALARRAGVLDGFHGYPEQNPAGKPLRERQAYEKGFSEGRKNRQIAYGRPCDD